MSSFADNVLFKLSAETKTSQVKEAVKQLKESLQNGKRTLGTCYIPEVLYQSLSYNNEKLNKNLGLSLNTVDKLIKKGVSCLYQAIWFMDEELLEEFKMNKKGIAEVKSALSRYGLETGCANITPLTTKKDGVPYVETDGAVEEMTMLALWTHQGYIDEVLRYASTQVPNTWRTIMQIEPTDKKITRQGAVGSFWDMF